MVGGYGPGRILSMELRFSSRCRWLARVRYDVQMEGMTGLQLQSRLVASRSRIPIIFITAYYEKESHQRAMQAGAVAFLNKPFTDEQLLQTIRSALGHKKGGMGTT